MIIWMCKILAILMEWIIGMMVWVITSFIFLCMNCFTIPAFIVLRLICKIIRVRKPHTAWYSLMLYPTWSDKPRHTLMGDLKEINRKENAKVKKYRPIRAWEERFF